MKLTVKNENFLNSFDHVGHFHIGKNVLELFIHKVNANSFDYNYLVENLIDPMIDFSLSRKVIEQYRESPGRMSRKAREKFIEYIRNKGELGELLLYCFLETHLKAPKILSKLELKTSTNHYVKGADGVHFLKLENGDFQIIYGESKTEKKITTGLSNAFKSIYEFKNSINSKGFEKSGLPYERSIISDHLVKETFSDDEKEFIQKIIYPVKENNFEVDDAFGIFIGYEMSVLEEDLNLENDVFREKITAQIYSEVEGKLDHIRKKIEEFKLQGHNFYLYILPFTDLDETRKEIQRKITL